MLIYTVFKRLQSLLFWTGVRFPSLPFLGVPWFRQGKKVVIVDGTKP
ncbi:hypothetical protein BOW87_gp053 [Synechococcus phage S-CAM3]|uniref:Uncharacterized protein n=1 Tax=Synechococcus phage S-CAM3 TaxID=1883366 RepID=A0A1D8KJ92_9CAUD|nr:hypothetical protein BOW87_gp053 [Synechococcus phage S-CAM3]AOV58709.1 hypothetical protein S250808_204 [Synechococcus phage S-CAM3]AOV59188.1 hypothetical protein C421010_205 [Synechococcus phage S-CAM3]